MYYSIMTNCMVNINKNYVIYQYMITKRQK